MNRTIRSYARLATKAYSGSFFNGTAIRRPSGIHQYRLRRIESGFGRTARDLVRCGILNLEFARPRQARYGSLLRRPVAASRIAKHPIAASDTTDTAVISADESCAAFTNRQR